jgi:hypothetical protein
MGLSQVEKISAQRSPLYILMVRRFRWNEYMKRVHAGKLNLACVRHRIKSHVHHLENTDRLECLFGWVDVEATTFFFLFRYI